MKLKKTKKIDVRLDTSLFDLIENHALSLRLSRAQVVERALLHFFGQTVKDTLVITGKAPAQSAPIGPVSAERKTA